MLPPCHSSNAKIGNSPRAPFGAMSFPALCEPSASIVICNYNHGRFLREAIDSALDQSKKCQVIVVDDGSTDDSKSILSQYAQRVELVYQPNAGQARAYNTGMSRATGDIVLFLDADDALAPDAMAEVGRHFSDGVVKVHFRLFMVDENGTRTGHLLPSALASGDVGRLLVDHGLLYASPPGSGNAYRRAVLERLYPLPDDPSDKVGADFFAIYGAVAFGLVAACPGPLGNYRLHRRPAEASQQLVFGNAALGNDESAKVELRYGRLSQWVAACTDGIVRYPDRFLDFSVLKVPYASRILERPYWQAIQKCSPMLTRLLRAIWLQPDYAWRKKLALTVWTLLVLTAPRRTALRAARFVCNPANRSA